MDIKRAEELLKQGNANLVGSASDTLAAYILAVEALEARNLWDDHKAICKTCTTPIGEPATRWCPDGERLGVATLMLERKALAAWRAL